MNKKKIKFTLINLKIMKKTNKSSFGVNRLFLFLFIFSFIGISKFNSQAPVTQTFTYTGAMQQFTVPPCVGSMTVIAIAAAGGTGGSGGSIGGTGSLVRGVMTATPGSVMNIFVGGQGTLTAGGFNGGGNGGISSTSQGAGGGGASDIRIGGLALLNRIIVAAGGGGGGGNSSYTPISGNGGAGSAFTSSVGFGGSAGGGCASGAAGGESGGLAPSYGSGGGGGGLTSGGGGGGQPSAATGGFGCNGTLGNGGDGGGTSFICGGATGGVNGGGGGGGGYYGGGGGMTGTGGCNGGGGGGSAWINSTMFSNTSFSTAVSSGHGTITLTYAFNGSLTNATVTPFAICAGASATINASGSSTYTWNTNSNASSIIVTPNTSNTYTVAGTNSIGCISSAVITVTVNNLVPSMTILSSTNSICPTNTVILTAAGAINYSWTGGVSNGVAFSPLSTSNYTVTGSNGCGTSTALTTVTVTPLPVIGISTSSAVCAGNTASLSAGGALTYTWMPGNLIGASVIVSPLVSTIYTLTGTTPICAGVYTLSLIAKPNPTVTTSASNSIICAGAQVTLTAFGASTYTWQSGPTVSSSLVVSPIAPTAYQVSGTNSLGCTSNSTQVVLVNPSPIINVIASETLICAGGSSTLTASGGSNYTWNFGPTTAAVVVSPTANTVYTVISTGAGCNATQTVSVDVFTQTLTVSNSTAICMGSSVTLNASGGTTYLWSNGGTGSSIFVYPSVSTLYTVSAVTVINNMSCNSTGSVNLTINPNPTVTAVLTRSVICRGESTILTANGANTYVWNNTATTPSFVINPIINTNYTVTGTDANGCKGTGTVQVKVNTCTGISELSNQNGLRIYPNPNNGEFTIESQLAIDLLIINELGQTIKTIQLSSANNLQLKVSDLANGIYFIVGKNKITNINQKIIVNK